MSQEYDIKGEIFIEYMTFFSKLTVGRLEGRSRSDLLVKITMKGEDVERC